MSHYHAKRMFLTRLQTPGIVDFRLLVEELIVLSHYETKHFGTETRTVPFYELCEPKLTVNDNKVKSGFDYSGPSSIFTKQEKANMMSTLKMLEMKSNKKLQSLAQINVYGKA